MLSVIALRSIPAFINGTKAGMKRSEMTGEKRYFEIVPTLLPSTCGDNRDISVFQPLCHCFRQYRTRN